ncbi:MAG: NAD(P)H-hydrate epimerase [Bacteroidota bacterium]
MAFPTYKGELPHLTTEQMVAVDRLMIGKYQIELSKMMENAGRALATLARAAFLKGDVKQKKVAILVGTGGNGGGAMVCARHLFNWGADVTVYISKPKGRMTRVPAEQLAILRCMEVAAQLPNALETDATKYDLIIDGIIGYSIKGEPKGGAKKMINWANDRGCPILALDAPSGVELSTGKVHEPAIRAAATLTLALPKKGLFEEAVIPYRGSLYLADISVPPMLYQEKNLNIKVGPVFSVGEILLLEN